MKSLLILSAVVVWCATSSAQEADTTGKRQEPPIEKRAAKADNAEFEIRIETSGGLVKYYRRDQLVLSRAQSHPDLYYARGPDGLYASIIINKPKSPRIGISEHLERINIEIERVDASTLKLMVINLESNYTEAYMLTPKSIAPVSADEYSCLLAQMEAAQKTADAFAEYLKELIRTVKDEQPSAD